MNETQNLFSMYQLDYIQKLGEGSFGKVYKAFDQITKKIVAVKVLFNNKSESESNLLQKMNHYNIVKLIRIINVQGKNSQNEKLQIFVLEYMEGGSLNNYMSLHPQIAEAICIKLMKNILNGLAYLHKYNIIHRDIKPDNILLNKDGIPKIADFGLSVHFESFDYTKQQCGTYIYMAPEELLNKIYSKPVDIWAAGIIMYQLLQQNHHPFWKQEYTKQEYIGRIFNGQIQYKISISSAAKDLLTRMLKINVTDRYSVHQALQHPWITGRYDQPIPLSLQEQFIIFDAKTKLINIIKSLLFIKYLTKPKNSYGYMLRQKGFHIKKVEYSLDNSPLKETLSNKQQQFEDMTPTEYFESHIGAIDYYTPDHTPIERKTFYEKNQRVNKLSRFYEGLTKQQRNDSQNFNRDMSPIRKEKKDATKLTFTQASREYAELVVQQSLQKLRKQQKRPTQIKLEPLDKRHKRTSSMITLSQPQY